MNILYSLNKIKKTIPCYLQMYVAVGFGRDKRNLQGMDVSACYKEGDRDKLYLVISICTNEAYIIFKRK